MFLRLTTGRGVRQGCSLPPLLFAVVADALLQRLQRSVVDATERLIADDTAMHSASLCRDGDGLKQVFSEIE